MKNRGTELPNPFITAEYFRLKSKQKIEHNRSLNEVYDSDGVVHSGVIGFVKLPKIYDSERFFKMYKPGLKVISELSDSSTKVLLYLMSVMGYSDTVEFNIHKCSNFTGYKDKSYIYKAVKELKEKNVIADTDIPRLFFLNPTYFYLGNRLELVK